MRAARRVVLDEIISSIIPEFVSLKKAQRHLKPEHANQAVKTCSLADKMSIPVPGQRENVGLAILYQLQQWIFEQGMLFKESVDKIGMLATEAVQPDQESSSCEVNYPPGFGHPMIGTCILAESSTISFSHIGNKALKLKSPCYINQIYDNIEYVQKRVENALHLSANMSLFEYLLNFAKEEVMKLADSAMENKLNEVDATKRGGIARFMNHSCEVAKLIC
ncbi:hypothetical protein HHK36_013190 [Tetracentron sinense]|uniref:Uncharacterized protein n=1 Tax=Tetracentron sinense TaxID=13715 RepID=A0A835DG86_TETSI|nr:hypothetical protein HHK36_013190 [Tetracentron sinense]